MLESTDESCQGGRPNGLARPLKGLSDIISPHLEFVVREAYQKPAGVDGPAQDFSFLRWGGFFIGFLQGQEDVPWKGLHSRKGASRKLQSQHHCEGEPAGVVGSRPVDLNAKGIVNEKKESSDHFMLCLTLYS